MSIVGVPDLKEIKIQEDCFNEELNSFVILYKEENVKKIGQFSGKNLEKF